MSDSFMRQRHQTLLTPQGAVFQLVRKSTGTTPQTAEKIVKGMGSEVYRVDTDADRRMIVRIRHFGDVSMAQQAWAMRQARNAGVPVPEVHTVETLDTPVGPRDAMVMEEAEGQPYSALAPALNPDEHSAALADAGRVLRLLHRVKTNGFYRRHDDGTWDFGSWRDLTNTNLEDRANERDEILAAGFSERDFGFMLAMIKRLGEEFPCDQPVLCHNDYGPNHVFFGSDLRVSAVIDFGMFQGGPPITDFAHGVDVWDAEMLRSGYGDDAQLSRDTFHRQLNMHNIALRMGLLAHNMRIGNHDAAKRVAADLRATIEALRADGT